MLRLRVHLQGQGSYHEIAVGNGRQPVIATSERFYNNLQLDRRKDGWLAAFVTCVSCLCRALEDPLTDTCLTASSNPQVQSKGALLLAQTDSKREIGL